MATLPPFEPSKYLSKKEIERGFGKAKVVEFSLGFAIQLGDFGNYHPATTADCEPTNTVDADMSDWDVVSENWWFRVSGDTAIHLSKDPTLGWSVSQIRFGESLGTPSYIPKFDEALAHANGLFNRLAVPSLLAA